MVAPIPRNVADISEARPLDRGGGTVQQQHLAPLARQAQRYCRTDDPGANYRNRVLLCHADTVCDLRSYKQCNHARSSCQIS